MCPVIPINPWYLLNVGGMKQPKGALGLFPSPPPQHTLAVGSRWGEIYFAMAPTVTQKHGLIFILRVIYVAPGPPLGDGSMCGVSTEIPFRARCSPRDPRTVLSWSVNRRKKCVTVSNSSRFSGTTSQTLWTLWGERRWKKKSKVTNVIVMSRFVQMMLFTHALHQVITLMKWNTHCDSSEIDIIFTHFSKPFNLEFEAEREITPLHSSCSGDIF